MSTPASGRSGAQASAPAAAGAGAASGPASAAGQQAPATTGQQAPASTGQQTAAQQAPAPAPSGEARGSSTPRMLRWARGAAAAAALLTGVVATGTFGTGGLNATPNVIAQQWVSAEEARVEIAHADLLAAQRVAQDDPDLRSAYDEAVGTVGQDLTRVAGSGEDAGAAATPWTSFVVGAERAVGDGSREVYADASAQAREAASATTALSEQHAEDLRTGSRSTLTAVVGSMATLLLLGILVWLALRTRRIVNVPLVIATAITAGLTYISLNPSALPVDYDRRVGQASATATALQEVYQARQSLYAVDLGMEDRWATEAGEAQSAVSALDVTSLDDDWNEIASAAEGVEDGGVTATTALSDSQQAFGSLEDGLRSRLDEQLGESAAAVGRPAAITSGAALLLGLVAAALAWAGINQRLREYR